LDEDLELHWLPRFLHGRHSGGVYIHPTSFEQMSSVTTPAAIFIFRCFLVNFFSYWSHLPSAVAPSPASFSRCLRAFFFCGGMLSAEPVELLFAPVGALYLVDHVRPLFS
jgi:hypothetical protein